MGKRFRKIAFYVVVCLGLLFIAVGVSAAATVTTDADVAAELKLLLGDGSGVTDQYLAKSSTRLQAAIISLRLQGQLDEAMAYEGDGGNFTDAGQVNSANQVMLAFLKNNPEYGWLGTGTGQFEPLKNISSQQLYKVLLEVMGYQQGTDFEYADTEQFAASKGLLNIAGTASLTNAHIATALVEALSSSTAGGTTLFAELQTSSVIEATAAEPMGERITIRDHAELGAYFADKDGKTLYFFTKDSADLESCQGNCLVNWPIFHAEHLQIPPSLSSDDFSEITRADGTLQTTYKGWPLYYFVKDTSSGDVTGEAVGGFWFVIDPAAFDGTAASKVKTYNIDIKEMSFGTEPLTVEAGSKIVFTNYDDMEHNAVAVNGEFSIPLIGKGESQSITLTEAGTYDYFCEPHKAFMTGQIIVK